MVHTQQNRETLESDEITPKGAGSVARKTKRQSRNRGAEAAAPDGGRSEPKQGMVREWTKSIVIAFVLFLCLRTFVLQTFVIISGSMAETLLVGDMLIANRLAVGPRIPGTRVHLPGYSQPRRGDVMVFDPHHEVDMKLVKRIAGLPGDTLQMRGGVLFVNGWGPGEPYLNPALRPDVTSPDFRWQTDYLTSDVDPATYRPTLHEWGPLVVPAGHYFMLGDNRDASFDSRYWGPLEAWRLEGRVSLLYFSYNKGSYSPFPALREIRWRRVGRTIAAISSS